MFYIQEVSAVHITGAAQELAFPVGAAGNAVTGLQRSHCTALRADGCGDRNIPNSASNSRCCFLVNLTRATARLFQLSAPKAVCRSPAWQQPSGEAWQIAPVTSVNLCTLWTLVPKLLWDCEHSSCSWSFSPCSEFITGRWEWALHSRGSLLHLGYPETGAGPQYPYVNISGANLNLCFCVCLAGKPLPCLETTGFLPAQMILFRVGPVWHPQTKECFLFHFRVTFGSVANIQECSPQLS